jgi:hypothetical protein
MLVACWISVRLIVVETRMRLRGLEVEYHLDFCDLLHRKVGWLVAFENAPGIDANLVEPIAEAAAIAHQAAGQGELTEWVDRGQRMAGRQRRELFRVPVVEDAAADQDRTDALLRKTCECVRQPVQGRAQLP